MENRTGQVFGILGVTAINILQLLQVLSFIKDAPKGGSWNSNVKDFFDACKSIALRFDDSAFIALYSLSCVLCVVSFVGYLIFSTFVHKLNKTNGVYFLFLFEYVVFAAGFVPMVSKFVEVQICNDSLKIDSYTSVKCFDTDQLVLLQVGFASIGLAFIMSAVVFPTLKYERNSVEKLWGNESYVEGFYYLILLGSVSLLCYIMLPWVGVLLCSVAALYMLVFECYDSVWVSCSRIGVLSALVWAYASAYVLKDNQSSGNDMIYALPVAYGLGYGLRLLRTLLIKRRTFGVPAKTKS
jgi:hypothetical protein